ncbi:CYFA0S19e01728g1_1 [Cyberlindnera fabianii]|uniref:CYFA0S19e01728g1_1 n=1 Tax=Cyberlindnera fabianii TaxID=36022 RepID=A0A061B6Z6_CYBFA|nr:CYFA0S19e01728g1_1 [Cyberlindnera fabianii]
MLSQTLRIRLPQLPRPLLPIIRNFSSSVVQAKESPIATLNILADTSAPLNNIDTVTRDSLVFSSGLLVKDKTTLLLANRVLEFEPKYEIKNGFIVEFAPESLQFLKLINPQPDLIVIGLGKKSRLLSQINLEMFQSLGVRVELSDTKNAARNFDLLATERPSQVGAILLPPNV